MADQTESIIDVLTTDHREVEQLFGQLEMLRGVDESERRRDLTEKVITELIRHSIAEEAYLYPATRKFVPGGDALADRELSEHAEAEQLMKDLEKTDVGDPRFDQLLTRFMGVIRQHVQEEEGELFPQLARHAGTEELRELGGKVQAIKKVAPTRPHPMAPDTPPANKLLAPGVGLVDRVRDALSGRGKG
ncbi:hemerythrin superfamily protein [Streptosporangium becharense]|uniref:Hemerythrin superfamily protein n=1 Tax=Streptosporangium becharense TaxID=1816182 RepID=A0A7W9IKV4_9ACTN|nr:hemerythrin domain-containing protein [Streptosporangium becharense]MBB2913173.1 hemerythrin superfamily protein [Streptosporangium becharense]MBB5822156.1 hemerythrin superfamily protein [Streptosporangium becharense]